MGPEGHATEMARWRRCWLGIGEAAFALCESGFPKDLFSDGLATGFYVCCGGYGRGCRGRVEGGLFFSFLVEGVGAEECCGL